MFLERDHEAPVTRPCAPARRIADRFLAGQGGSMSVEYALISSLMAILAIGGLMALAVATGDLFQLVTDAFRFTGSS